MLPLAIREEIDTSLNLLRIGGQRLSKRFNESDITGTKLCVPDQSRTGDRTSQVHEDH